MTEKASTADLEKQMVLIVDDEESFRLVLREVIDEVGYRPIEAETAAEGLRLFRSEHPQSVLLDIHLPDRSGFEVLREIKADSPQTNVIVTTGDAINENERLAIRLGADDFIGKPIHPLELQYLLDKASSARRNVPETKLPRLLLISESPHASSEFRRSIKDGSADMTTVFDLGNLPDALASPHDIAIVQVSTSSIQLVLEQIRRSIIHVDIPILVDRTQLNFTGELAGIMPRFRAMPCTPAELISLTQRRIATHIEKSRPKPLL